MPRPIHISCAADARFAIGLAVTLRSAAEQLSEGWELDVHAIDGGLGARNRRRLESSVADLPLRLHWVEPDAARFRGAFVSGRIRIASYFRLLTPEILPAAAERGLYLDSDLLVEADLAELWDVDLAGAPLGAVQDSTNPYVSSAYGLPGFERLGLAPEQKYFNAGLLLLDLRSWREEEIHRAVLRYVLDHPERIRFHDQDGLNALLAKRWRELDPRWNRNHQPGLPETRCDPGAPAYRVPAVDGPSITHFTSGKKPWHAGSGHPANPRFFDVLDRTAWRGWRPKPWSGRSLASAWRRLGHEWRSRFT